MEKVQEEVRRSINGVDMEGVEELKAALESDPDLGSMRFYATHDWVEGARSRTVVDRLGRGGKEVVRSDAFVLESDEPEALLGKDTAPNAVVWLLHALASSLSVTIAYHAAMREMTIERLNISIEGDIDVHGFLGLSDEVRSGFQDLRVKIDIAASGTREEVEGLVRYAESVSPIMDSLRNRIPLEVKLV